MKLLKGLGRVAGILVVVIVIVIIAFGAYFALSSSTTTATQSTSTQSTSTVAGSSTTATSSSSSNSSVPSQLVIDETSNPGSLDPVASVDNNGGEIIQETNMPLVFCSVACSANALTPVLASSWTSSSDGLTYTFNLRNGIYYSNGDPLNAYVVWWNVYRFMITNQAASFVMYLYFNSSGVTAGDLNSMNTPTNSPGSNQTLLKIMENNSNSATVLNATAIQFHLTNPYAAFIDTTICSCFAFSDPYTVEQHGGVVANQPNAWMSANATTVGDGPYVMQIWVPNQYAILVKNPDYWAENYTSNIMLKPATIPKIMINYKTDELTRELDVESDKSQASIVTFNDVNNVLNSTKTLYIPNIGLSGSPEFVGIDAQKSPTNDTLVRRAIVEAINVSQIEQVVYAGYSAPFVGPTPKPYFGYNSSIAPIPYNVTDAKSLLAQAGYPNGSGFPSINLVYETSGYLSLAGQIMKQDLAQIGITLTLQEVTSSAYLSLESVPGTSSSAPYLMAGSWTGWPDFSGYEFIVAAEFGVYNFLQNQTIYNLILQSNSQLNSSLRAQEISQITQDIQQQSAFIWLGQDKDIYPTGGGFGPTVWNSCVVGQWYSVNIDGPDFNALSYNCNPS